MTVDWYYASDGKRQGPVSLTELTELAQRGTVAPDALVWKEGYEEWVPLHDVEDLSTSTSSTGIAVEARPAGFWLRAAALTIDAVVLLCANLLVVIPVIATVADPLNNELPGSGWEVALNVLSLMMAWLYFAIQESSRHRGTLGKRAVRLEVLDAKGRPISFGRATGRHVAKVVSVIPIGLGFVMAAFTDRKQALHDLIASTVVETPFPVR